MSWRRRLVVNAVLVLSPALALASGEQETPDAGGRIPSVTRLVSLFGGLEGRWLKAIRARDASELESVLADDFEMRLASRPDQPIPRAEYLKQALTASAAPWVVRRMAARDLGGPVIVSFRLELDAPAAGPSSRVFVVDLWEPFQGGWKVAARYVGSVAGLPAGIPGAVAMDDRLPKRY